MKNNTLIPHLENAIERLCSGQTARIAVEHLETLGTQIQREFDKYPMLANIEEGSINIIPLGNWRQKELQIND